MKSTKMAAIFLLVAAMTALSACNKAEEKDPVTTGDVGGTTDSGDTAGTGDDAGDADTAGDDAGDDADAGDTDVLAAITGQWLLTSNVLDETEVELTNTALYTFNADSTYVINVNGVDAAAGNYTFDGSILTLMDDTGATTASMAYSEEGTLLSETIMEEGTVYSTLEKQ